MSMCLLTIFFWPVSFDNLNCCEFAISYGSPAFQKIKAVELLKVHLESSDQIITLSLPDPPLVSTSAPIKSLDHGSTLGFDNKQTALFFFFFFLNLDSSAV